MQIGLGLSLSSMQRRRDTPAFTPAALFASGEQGVWLDPSDLTTLYQDSAGTTPVTADGEPVGRIEDKSSNGNHATQGTASARPIYRTDGTLHWLEFDGVDDELLSSDINPFRNTDAELAMFIGYRHLSAQTGYAFSSQTSSSLSGHSNSYLLRAVDSPDWVLGGSLNTMGIPQNLNDQFVFVDAERNGDTNGQYGWGTNTENASIGTTTSSAMMWGSRNGNVHANMRLYQSITIDRRATEQEINGVRAFVAGKSGVTL